MLIFESTFPNDFHKEEITKILNYALTGKFCQVVCVPGGGKATILRLLAHNRNLLKFHLKEKEGSLRLVYINFLELTDYTEAQIAKFLLLSLGDETPNSNDPIVLTKRLHEVVNKLADKGQTLVLLFDHFDEYQNQLTHTFFQLLKDLKTLAKYRFSTVFATRRDLKELVDSDILNKYYDFFIDNTVYIKIYDEKASNFLFSQIERVFQKKLSQKDKRQIIAITGGHAKLTKVIAEMVLRENLKPEANDMLIKPLIVATLFELWLYLTAQEQQALRDLVGKIKSDKEQAFENLKTLGLILEDSSFAIPLFEQFIKTTIPTIASEKITFNQDTKEINRGTSVISDLLSPQEYRLLRFLIENSGKIIERGEIIKSVWPDAQVSEGISDEAIDQMVFRIRKKVEDNPNNPQHILTVKGQGFRFQP